MKANPHVSGLHNILFSHEVRFKARCLVWQTSQKDNYVCDPLSEP